MTAVGATIAYLKRCQVARAAGYPVAFTTDPAWLLDMAINRRAGWPDDDSFARGSAMPVNGRYPRRAQADSTGEFCAAQRCAYLVNSRSVVREHDIPQRFRARLAHRVFAEDAY